MAAVMEMLLSNEGLDGATDVLFIGDSTGGIAAAHFIDHVYAQVSTRTLSSPVFRQAHSRTSRKSKLVSILLPFQTAWDQDHVIIQPFDQCFGKVEFFGSHGRWPAKEGGLWLITVQNMKQQLLTATLSGTAFWRSAGASAPADQYAFERAYSEHWWLLGDRRYSAEVASSPAVCSPLIQSILCAGNRQHRPASVVLPHQYLTDDRPAEAFLQTSTLRNQFQR